MSLRPQSPLPPVPEDTARVAQIAFRRGNSYLLPRARLGTIFADTEFADLYPKRGQPAYAPWRLALVTLLQFREGLSDRLPPPHPGARRPPAYTGASFCPTLYGRISTRSLFLPPTGYAGSSHPT